MALRISLRAAVLGSACAVLLGAGPTPALADSADGHLQAILIPVHDIDRDDRRAFRRDFRRDRRDDFFERRKEFFDRRDEWFERRDDWLERRGHRFGRRHAGPDAVPRWRRDFGHGFRAPARRFHPGFDGGFRFREHRFERSFRGPRRLERRELRGGPPWMR